MNLRSISVLAALAASIVLIAATSPASARLLNTRATAALTPDVAAVPAYPLAGEAAHASNQTARYRRAGEGGRRYTAPAAVASEGYLPHPNGCPRSAFCGCGAAVRIFGTPRRDLWPVSAWYRFPRSFPAAGMVGIPHAHHVYVLEYQVSGSQWMTSDFNSGGHMSRRQVQDVSRVTIVNPHGAVASYSARKHRSARHHHVRLAARR